MTYVSHLTFLLADNCNDNEDFFVTRKACVHEASDCTESRDDFTVSPMKASSGFPDWFRRTKLPLL
jgi:hypothetical protein